MLRTALVMVMLLTGAAHAEGERSLFGFEGTVGLSNGVGAGVRIGDIPFGGHITAAWQPVLVATEETDAYGLPSANLYFFSSFVVNADVYVLVVEPTPRSAVGFTAGYKYSTLLGHGGGAGFYAEIDPRQLQWEVRSHDLHRLPVALGEARA